MDENLSIKCFQKYAQKQRNEGNSEVLPEPVCFLSRQHRPLLENIQQAPLGELNLQQEEQGTLPSNWVLAL